MHTGEARERADSLWIWVSRVSDALLRYRVNDEDSELAVFVPIVAKYNELGAVDGLDKEAWYVQFFQKAKAVPFNF